MIQAIEQLELGRRLAALKVAVESCRARMDQVRAEEAEWLDMLARAEAEVTGKAPGSAGIELTGLILDNPYVPTA